GVLALPGQGGDGDPGAVGRLEHLLRRGAEGVGHQPDGMGERHLDEPQGAFAGQRLGERLPRPAGLAGRSPAVVVSVTVAAGRGLDAVLPQQRVEEAAVLLGDQVGEGGAVEARAPLHAGQLLRDEDVDAVRLSPHRFVDPPQLHVELIGREGGGPEDAEAARPGHGGHHVAAVAEGQDGVLHAELVADAGAHGPDGTPRRPVSLRRTPGRPRSVRPQVGLPGAAAPQRGEAATVLRRRRLASRAAIRNRVNESNLVNQWPPPPPPELEPEPPALLLAPPDGPPPSALPPLPPPLLPGLDGALPDGPPGPRSWPGGGWDDGYQQPHLG